jgi:hypothetical protein
MIQLDLSILNQKGTPMFNSDIFANRPPAGIAGRIFISTDTLAIYRDTGSTWDTLGGGGGGGTISGSIAAGQVAFGSALNTIAGTNNLFWDNVNSRLGIGTNTPAFDFDIVKNNVGIVRSHIKNESGATTAQTAILLRNNANNQLIISIAGNSYATLDNIQANDTYIQHNDSIVPSTSSSLILRTLNARDIKLQTNAIERIRVFGSTGNVVIQNGGTFTDGGQRLQVTGNVNFGGATGLTWDDTNKRLGIGNASPTRPLVVSGTGSMTGLEVTTISAISGAINFNTITAPITVNATSVNGFGFQVGNGINTNSTGTTLQGSFNTSQQFAPTSGSIQFAGFVLQNIINQGGTAIGITRGLYVNPTLSVAVDWRSIQWDNNTGWGLYGNGTAPSYFAGNVQIGSTTAISSTINLQVTGRQYTLHTTTYSGAAVQTLTTFKNVTINQTITGGNGINNQINTGLNIFSSTQSVPETTTYANIFNYNEYLFSAAGITLSANQATGGLRTISQLTTQNVFGGSFNGTMSHVSGIQINGYYNNATGTITPTITNAYQLLINDTGEFGHTFTFDKRWGIYQRGINDRNYLEGNLLLNSTTDTGQILQVNGAIRVNGQLSGTSGGNSGQHLIINCDGTQYKIALQNP